MAAPHGNDYFQTGRSESASGEQGELVETKCRYCGGRGTDPFGCPGPSSVCQVCSGTGKIRVTAPFETCAACRGTGRQIGRRLSCSSCSGRGVKTAIGPTGRCAACRGTGIQPGSPARLPCAYCSGSGLVAARVLAAARLAGFPPEGEGQATVSASVEDRISAYVSVYPGAQSADLQALLGMSKEAADRTLKQMVHRQRLREKRGAYHPA